MSVDPGSPPLLNGMYMAKVVDIRLFHRLRAENPGIGGKRLARALGCGLGQAQALMRGDHWQQDPEKVRRFNEYKHASVDVMTGEACAADLKAFGFGAAERRAASASMRPGSPRVEVDVETEAVAALAGEEPPPMKLDTSYFQGEVDTVIWRLLKELNGVKISKMSGREIAAAASAFLEKRALLRGEPTAIVRNENRGSLEKVGEMLLAEIARRRMKAAEPEMIMVEARE